MQKHAALVLGPLAMVAIIVALDVLLFRHHLWPRLMVNIGVVLVFAAFYFRFRSRL
jgi:predicted anti-sigma-YlaC factor YlaD